MRLDRPATTSPIWRLLRLLVSALAIALLSPLGGFSSPADAQGPRLNVASTTTYTVDAANQQIHVEGMYVLRNDVIPINQPNGSVRRTYFDEYGVVVPHSARQFVATINGLRLDTTFVAGEDYDIAANQLPVDLMYNDRRKRSRPPMTDAQRLANLPVIEPQPDEDPASHSS